MKITVMTADEQFLTLDVDRDESVVPRPFCLIFLFSLMLYTLMLIIECSILASFAHGC